MGKVGEVVVLTDGFGPCGRWRQGQAGGRTGDLDDLDQRAFVVAEPGAQPALLVAALAGQ
jgi:hypothetical protein